MRIVGGANDQLIFRGKRGASDDAAREQTGHDQVGVVADRRHIGVDGASLAQTIEVRKIERRVASFEYGLIRQLVEDNPNEPRFGGRLGGKGSRKCLNSGTPKG